MGLREYQRKRDFERTPEPRGRRGKRTRRGPRFVIQKHAARRLHYDFRLELDGVLKSWAVPKGPSLDPADKRLAVEVEDHPIDYGDFEGVIPQGQYGGGSVLLWDHGTWKPKGDPRESLARGKLEFELDGEKLHGRWLLVRTGSNGKPQWLLRKLADEQARPGDGAITELRPESVTSGLQIEDIGQRSSRVWQSHDVGKKRQQPAIDPASLPKARRGALPAFVPPQLATLVAEPPRGEGWLHEIKLDGYRALCRLEGGRARLVTRRERDWTDRFGRIASAAAFLAAKKALIDGEVVWLGDDGRTDFQALQQALGEGRDERLFYFAFDLLHLDGWDLRPTPLVERKEALRRLLAISAAEASAVRFSDHVEGEAGPFFRQACQHKLEGIVSKRRDGPYRERRGRDWLKVKCTAEQEVVIVGYSEPHGSREGLGALLLGVYENGTLRTAGKVGTGFDRTTLHDLLRRLRPLEQPTPPVVDPPRGYRARGIHRVEPKLVAQVAFSDWTHDGKLRHPSFHGLREDKEPTEVIREVPARGEETALKATKTPGDAGKSAKSPKAQSTTKPAERATRAGKGVLEVSGVRISNPDRVLYPAEGITKLDLVRYYESVGDRMLPYLAGRPLTLMRCPAGLGKPCFYQKHLTEGTPPELIEVEVTERSGEHEVYVCVESLAGLISLAQLAVLELHPWGSRRKRLEKPDVLVFDLDPGPGVAPAALVTAARDLRALLEELGLESFAKLSGGKGLHVVAPIVPELDWDPAKAFTRAVVELIAEREPERYVTSMAKAKRKGRIFLDYLRNGFGNTAVAPYSTRARAGAPVATPVRWEELGGGLAPDHYNIRNLPRRLASLRRDPWAGYSTLRQRVPKAVLRELKVGS